MWCGFFGRHWEQAIRSPTSLPARFRIIFRGHLNVGAGGLVLPYYSACLSRVTKVPSGVEASFSPTYLDSPTRFIIIVPIHQGPPPSDGVGVGITYHPTSRIAEALYMEIGT